MYLRQCLLGQLEPEWDSPHPPANTPPDQKDYWRLRQQLLGVETHGEILGPREILFVERFKELGNCLEWIPRDRESFRPTSDFVWLNNGGIEVELKSTVARYKSIHEHIVRAVSKAREQDVVKENFFIDFGRRSLIPKLAGQLSSYNANNMGNQINSLWVMTNGNFTDITLK